jgi:zinc protease
MRYFTLALLGLTLFLTTPAQAGILDIKDVKSESGLSAWLVEDHTVPVISLRFVFKGSGSAGDTTEKQGLARMLSNTMDEGAGDLNSQQFQEELNDHSISLSFSATRDNFGGSVKTLAKHKDEAFRLLALALTKPRFDQEAIDRMRLANISRIKGDMTDPDWIAARLMNATIFEGHPYAMNSGGTLSSLPRITAQDLRTKVKEDLTQDRLLISVAGDISEAELKQLLDNTFGGLEKTASKPVASTDVKFPTKAQVVLLERDIPQTVVQMSLPGISWIDPDYYAAEVMNFVFGGAGFGSRLMETIREKRGLTYGIYSGLSHSDYANTLAINTSTRNETTKELIDLTAQQMNEMRQNPITAKELKNAVTYLTGSVPLDLTSTDKISAYMIAFQTEGLPMDYLDMRERELKAVTIADVMRVSAHLLSPAQMTTILVGKPGNITPDKTVTKLPNVE